MRLIDADALMSNLMIEDFKEHKFCYPCKEIMDAIKEQPTIEERKKGKWIPVTKIYKVTEGQFPQTHIEWVDATEPDEIDGVRCSECGTVYDFIEARNWCSECGADMREPMTIPEEIINGVLGYDD